MIKECLPLQSAKNMRSVVEKKRDIGKVMMVVVVVFLLAVVAALNLFRGQECAYEIRTCPG